MKVVHMKMFAQKKGKLGLIISSQARLVITLNTTPAKTNYNSYRNEKDTTQHNSESRRKPKNL